MNINWQRKRVLILGAARQGQALARYLAHHGAVVTLNDHRPREEMGTARRALGDQPIQWVFGSHPIELLDEADLVCLSGGIPLTLPIVAEAQKRGIPLSNDTQIFMEVAPCKTIGITGSAGKTTTTTLVGRMAQAEVHKNESARMTPKNSSHTLQPFNAWIGGNIGDPLLNHVDEMKTNDLAVLEISSFQLEQMTISPNVVGILNITPNHLDRHGTMEAYIAAKARILEFQKERDTAVLGRDDPGAWRLRNKARGNLLSFGINRLNDGQEGTYIQDGTLYLQAGKANIPLFKQENIHLRGEHNRLNVLAACAIAHAANLSRDAMLNAIEDFHGVPHRLELVREWRGVHWYNDSIATAPERTMAAIRSFEEPIVLLLGGRDKDLPWSDLANLVHQRIDHVILFGEAAEKIIAALGESKSEKRPYSLTRCERLQEAIHTAAEITQPGNVVLLSPGGTSFDEFQDFEERGEHFRRWVLELP